MHGCEGVEHGLCRSCGLVHLEVELTHSGWPRVERLWVSMLSRELILELTYWTPLVALLLLSLGLIALKRISGLPPWAERMAAPPFYFVSLPIATLIVGMEMFVWMAHVVKRRSVRRDGGYDHIFRKRCTSNLSRWDLDHRKRPAASDSSKL